MPPGVLHRYLTVRPLGRRGFPLQDVLFQYWVMIFLGFGYVYSVASNPILLFVVSFLAVFGLGMSEELARRDGFSGHVNGAVGRGQRKGDRQRCELRRKSSGKDHA